MWSSSVGPDAAAETLCVVILLCDGADVEVQSRSRSDVGLQFGGGRDESGAAVGISLVRPSSAVRLQCCDDLESEIPCQGSHFAWRDVLWDTERRLDATHSQHSSFPRDIWLGSLMGQMEKSPRIM